MSDVRKYLAAAEEDAKGSSDYLHAAQQPGAAINDLIASAAFRLKAALRNAYLASRENFVPIPNRPYGE